MITHHCINILHTTGHSRGYRLLFFSLMLCGVLLLSYTPGQAVYRMRYSTIDTGAITFVGNTLGLDKTSGQNNPGNSGSIGAFTSLNTTLRVGTFPYGTTLDYTKNGSASVLHLPAGSTVLYAELIWSGYYADTATGQSGQTVASDLGNSVTFATPSASYSVPPDLTTEVTLTYAANGKAFYVRTANVTADVKSAGAGTYSCGAVPAVCPASNDNDNYAGWTLAVVYRNPSLPSCDLTFWTGGELTTGSTPNPSVLSGFSTPGGTSTLVGRMMVTAGEGDYMISGDQMNFGPTSASMSAVSGPNNPVSNFFCSMINNDAGTLNSTDGTFATLNWTSTSSTGTRQGWDITNVDIHSLLQHSQTQAYLQGTTTGDAYIIAGVGMQIDVGSPNFTPSTIAVNKTSTYVGDTLTFTTVLDNTTGTADATNVVLNQQAPNGLSFVAGSLTLNGVAQPSADVTAGVPVGTIAVGAKVTAVYKMLVDYIPPAPATASYSNSASWTYQYQSAPTLPKNNATFTTSTVVTNVPRLNFAKTSSPTGVLAVNSTVTYTLTVSNDGTVASSGTTLLDPLPTGESYLAGTTTRNGTAVADVGGQMPFASARNIDYVSAASPGTGAVAISQTYTITFQAKVTQTLPSITNTATLDPDGAGPAPALIAAVTNPQQFADLAVAITDGQTTDVAGSTYNYTITVTNNGPTTVTGMNLLFQHPTSVTVDTYTPASGSYNALNGNWSGISLAQGQQIILTVQITLSATAVGPVVVTATVSNNAGIGDTNTANNTASDSDNPVIYYADLGIAVTDNSTFAMPGAAVTYTITVTNYGPSMEQSITLQDTLPATLTSPVYTPSVGVYNTQNNVWTGVNLASGQSVTLTMTATLSSSATGTLVNSVTVTSSADVTDPNSANNTASDTDDIGLSISGHVFQDLNHDSQFDGGEGATGVTLYVKLAPNAGGNATQAIQADPTTGAYKFAGLGVGTYKIILSTNNTLTDTTVIRPTGWISTEAPTGSYLNVALSTAELSGDDLGLWHGSSLSGTFFLDSGVGGGTANDGVQNGTEPGRQGWTVRVTDAANQTIYDNTTTSSLGAYTLWIPSTATGTLVVRALNDPAFITTGGSVGNTGGTLSQSAATVTFTHVVGSIYTLVNFGDVPVNTFTANGQQLVLPATPAFYPHVFTAGTQGQVTFTTAAVATPNLTGWSVILYRDTNGNGVLDPGEPQISGPITVTAGQAVAIIARVYAPDGAQSGAAQTLTLTANFTYTHATPALAVNQMLTDLTQVTASNGLTLLKSVDKTTAKSGDLITYTITYENTSGYVIQNVVVYDEIPAYTSFVGAAYGALPANLTACTLTTPNVGDTSGTIRWTFAGTLSAGSTGTVTFQVKIQ